MRNYDAYRVDFSASIYIGHTVFFKHSFLIWLLNFNQLDATSKVMYRHEIMCIGKHGLVSLKIIVCRQ